MKKEIVLTEREIEIVLDNLVDYYNENGDFDIDIDIENDKYYINAKGYVQFEGYREKNTNAFVETYRNACVHLTAYEYDDDENKCAIPAAEKIVDEYLNESFY